MRKKKKKEKKKSSTLLHIRRIDNEMLELIIVGGSKGNVQSEYVCALPLGILSLYCVNN